MSQIVVKCRKMSQIVVKCRNSRPLPAVPFWISPKKNSRNRTEANSGGFEARGAGQSTSLALPSFLAATPFLLLRQKQPHESDEPLQGMVNEVEKSTLWTNAGVDQNFQRDLGAKGPYELALFRSLCDKRQLSRKNKFDKLSRTFPALVFVALWAQNFA